MAMATVTSSSLQELCTELRTVCDEFDRDFSNCPADDVPSGRERVRDVCAAFHASRATRRLLNALPRCVEFIVTERNPDAALLDLVTSTVGDACSLFWNASARPDPKTEMIECGVASALISMHKALSAPGVPVTNLFVDDCLEATLGVVPNLCQARFAHGHRNIHSQMLLESSDIVPFLLSHIERAEAKHATGYRATQRKELRIWFLSIHALANLSVNDDTDMLAQHFCRFDRFYEFCDAATLARASLWQHWNSLGSFTSLLRSPHALVALWALRSLAAFAANEPNRVLRALAVASSVDDIHRWSAWPETQEHATRLLQRLGIAPSNPLLQPDVRAPPPLLGAPALDRVRMSQFSDITLVVVDEAGVQVNAIAAHKVVLASRSSFFNAKFSSGMRDANDSRVIIDDVEPAAFLAAIDWAYTGALPARISSQLAVDLLGALCRFGMMAGGAVQQLEFLLTNRIDSRETATALLELCSMNAGVLPKLEAELDYFLQRTDPTKTRDERSPASFADYCEPPLPDD
jgi:hypothetical protein